jgi:hypothetical protein
MNTENACTKTAFLESCENDNIDITNLRRNSGRWDPADV